MISHQFRKIHSPIPSLRSNRPWLIVFIAVAAALYLLISDLSYANPLSVPYIRQVGDTDDHFNGYYACGATSAVMIGAYYNRFPSHPIWCTFCGPSHWSNFGWYVAPYNGSISSSYSLYGFSFNIGTADASNNLAYGAYGFIHYNDQLAKPFYARNYFWKHGLIAKVVYYPMESDVKNEINNGHPVWASTDLWPAGHVVVIKGYTGTGYYVADPFPYGSNRCSDGSNEYYTWSQMNVGNKWIVTTNPISIGDGVKTLYGGIKVRSGPSVSFAEVAASRSLGDTGIIVDDTTYGPFWNSDTIGDYHTWVKIRWNSDGATGWSAIGDDAGSKLGGTSNNDLWIDKTTTTTQTLSVSLTANPQSGTAPLNGVDLKAIVSGTALGSISYTFYCNRSDSGTNITYPNDFKIDGRNPDGTGGTVINQGVVTNYSGGTNFMVYGVCNYSSAGTYTEKVIAERGALAAEARTTVTVTTPPVQGSLSVTPVGGLTSSGIVGGPFTPVSQSYTLTNPGGSAINWTTSNTPTWVTVSPMNGTLLAGASATVTVSINANANTLSVGSYNGIVTFTNTTNGIGGESRSVSLTVTAPAAGLLSVNPAGGLSSSGPQGGPFTPSSQSYTLTNPGSSAINWTASNTLAWATLSQMGGTLQAGGSTTVTISINSTANSLSMGSYGFSVTFTNTTNGNGGGTRSVSLTVTAPTAGSLSVTPPDGLLSSGPQGGPFTPLSQSYTVINTGGSPINWTASNTQTWVTVSPITGTLVGGQIWGVTVSINANANTLSVGSYYDTVTFTNTTNGNGGGTRSVNLTINNPVPTAPTIATTSPLPAGTVGVAYSLTFLSSGGSGPFNWSVVSGSPPPGLSFDNTAALLNGTPTTAGTYNFRVRVTGSYGLYSEKGFSLTINNAASLTLTQSSGGGGGCSIATGTKDSGFPLKSLIDPFGLLIVIVTLAKLYRISKRFLIK